MLDAELAGLARARIVAEMNERDDQLRRDVEQIHGEMAARGMSRSGAIVQRITDRCALELKIRASMAYQQLLRVMAAAGAAPVEGLANDLKAEVAHYVEQNLAALSHHIERAIRSALGDAGELVAEMLSVLQRAGRQAVDTVNAEIDVYLVGLRRPAAAEGAQAQQIYNVYGPLGALVTGPYASAQVVQTINPEDRETLLRALEMSMHSSRRSTRWLIPVRVRSWNWSMRRDRRRVRRSRID